MQVLRDNDFKIKLSKCEFEKPEVKFLGHIVGGDGVKVDPSKTSSVEHWPVQTNMTSLRSFLGLATYFRKFIENFSRIELFLQTILLQFGGFGILTNFSKLEKLTTSMKVNIGFTLKLTSVGRTHVA